jgi:signal transduction histidine kinase
MDINLSELENKLNYYANSLKEYSLMLPGIMQMEKSQREEYLSRISQMSREMDEIISELVKKSKEDAGN